jgi:hypothetical protein
MNRRTFLQRLGVGSVAVGSVPLLGQPALAHLDSDEGNQRHFKFVCLSFLTGGEGTPAEAMVMEGNGIFGGGISRGTGDFQHITWPPPSTLLGHGLWRERHILSYERGFGSFAEIEASILTLRIRMLPGEDTGVDDFPATLKIVCNVGPAGLLTGQDEGYTLTLPDGTTFAPAVPAVGLTHISTLH